jgi:hypothetical protein
VSSVIDQADKLQKEFESKLIKDVTEIVANAWTLGITITEIKLMDSFIQDIGPSFYGDKVVLKAPDIKEIETDFGTVRIIK